MKGLIWGVEFDIKRGAKRAITRTKERSGQCCCKVVHRSKVRRGNLQQEEMLAKGPGKECRHLPAVLERCTQVHCGSDQERRNRPLGLYGGEGFLLSASFLEAISLPPETLQHYRPHELWLCGDDYTWLNVHCSLTGWAARN